MQAYNDGICCWLICESEVWVSCWKAKIPNVDAVGPANPTLVPAELAGVQFSITVQSTALSVEQDTYREQSGMFLCLTATGVNP